MLRIKYVGVTILCLSLWAGSLAAQTPAQKQRIEQLYAEDADAWSRHDTEKSFSFFDPTLVIVAPDGRRTSYSDWRQNLPATLARERHNQVRTTVKSVKELSDGFVASIEWQDNYQIYEPIRGWVPIRSSSPQEDTWRSDGRGNFRIVLVKFLPGETSDQAQVVRAVPLSRMIDHDSQLIAFLSGGALTAEERQRVAAFVAAEVRRDASTWYKKDVEVSKDLQLSRENPGAVTADLWQKWRWNYAISAAEDVEAQIVAAHDPVLAFDRERTTLITEQTIRSLRDAAAWVAQQTGRPQPDAQYSLNLRNTIRQQWRTWPNETLSSLTYIVKDFPATVEYMLGVMSDTQRREFLTSW